MKICEIIWRNQFTVTTQLSLSILSIFEFQLLGARDLYGISTVGSADA